MMQPDQVRQLIADGLPCSHLTVTGDGQHFEAIIVSDQFAGKSRVQRQQCINQILKPLLDSGELHALSMKTQTPTEWQEASARG